MIVRCTVRPWTFRVTLRLTVTVRVLAQRFPFAASAEYGPSGRYSSKLWKGTSGTVLNVLLVIARFADERRGRHIDPDTIALQHDDQ